MACGIAPDALVDGWGQSGPRELTIRGLSMNAGRPLSSRKWAPIGRGFPSISQCASSTSNHVLQRLVSLSVEPSGPLSSMQ